ncbi:MAG: C10 family peptidase [Bacteroidaceae bacterium]|nr:C10 family peptidase [Bacteroidaceae bacterium]
MKRILSTLTLLLCFAFTAVNAQGTYDQATMGTKVVEMETASWGQNSPFNNYCWSEYGGSTHAKAGCVPVAFAIVMRYHGFPAEGTSSTLYNCQASTYVEITDRTYDWEKMPLTNSSGWTTEQQHEVAKLISHLGHAFGVSYGVSQTSVSIGDSQTERLTKYFNYKAASATDQYPSNNNLESWKQKIKESLNNGCPVPYAANNTGTGDSRHMFVIDGYTNNDYFHFNFGWNGSGNGWFKLDNITPAQGDNYSWSDDSDGYTSKHQAFFNLMPNKTPRTVTATTNSSSMGTVSINGGTAGNSVSAEVTEGTKATLTAHPADGYALASWTKNGVIVGTKNPIQVTVGESGNEYVANFDDAANVQVEKTCTFKISDVTTSGVSGDYCSTWTTSDGIVLSCTKGSEPAYALSIKVNTFFAKAPVGSSETLVSDITYTLTAPEGYVIKSYSFKGKSPSSSYTIDVTVGGNTTNVTNASAGVVISASDINSRSTSFVLGSTYNNGRPGLSIMEDGVTVTIVSEGGASTPTPTTYTVTTTANPAEGGTAKFAAGTGSQKTQGDVENGTQITLYATANTGYNFVNWTKGGAEVSTDATYTFTATESATYVANFEATQQGGEGATTDPLAGKFFRLKVKNTSNYMNIANNTAHTSGAVGGVNVTSTLNDEKQVFCFDGNSTTGYKLKSKGGYYITCQPWNVDAISTEDGTLLTFETAGADNEYYIKWDNKNMNGSVERDDYFKAENSYVYCDAASTAATTWVLEEVIGKTLTVTFSGATWGNASSGYYDYVTTNTDPVVTVRTANGGKAIGYSTINQVKHPYLLHNNNFTISVPAPYKIVGYELTYKGHDFGSNKTFSYTTAQGSTTETITQNGVEKTLTVTGLENSEIAINVSDNSSKAGVIITALEITYIEDTDLETYTVAVTAGENGTARASAETVAEGDNVTLTATANTDYKFIGWFNGETKVSEANPYTFAVTSNISYEARFEELFPDGAYKVYWQADNRGYLAYYSGRQDEAVLADVTLGTHDSNHYTSTTEGVDLVWYLITAKDGERYLFHAATGSFLGANPSVQSNGTGNKLSTTEAWPIVVEPNTNSTRLGHYIITTVINGTKNLLCSGCGTSSFNGGHSVRWLVVNDANQKDGGAPLQLVKVDGVTVADDVMNAVRAVIEPRTFNFKAEVENWRDNNPNTHLGTITIGGTPLKLTPEHLTVSELTMPLNAGTTLAFTRKYRGFEFNGFYIGATSLGTNPTLTADNVAAINETTPLVAKFTATDDVTLFYDDDEFSYRIPAIAKTGTNRLVAISDYRHNLDDIGRDNHSTGKKRIDLVMRTSDDNGATWSDIKTIAAGDDSKVGSYLRAFGDAAVAAVGNNIVVMCAAGDVLYTSGTTDNPNRMARIFSNDNGANWTIEEMTTKMYSQSTSLIPNGGSAFFGSGKLAVDENFNGTDNARIYGALLVRIKNNDGNYSNYNNFVVYSDDLGATWKILGGSTSSIASDDEPKVEILPNGQILLSVRRGGGRKFRVFTYGTGADDKANGVGSWGDAAVNGCDNGGQNATNGEIICLDAKRPNGKRTKILLQSQPKGGSGQYERYNVTIWYKEVSADETYTPSSIASGWTQGLEVCPAGVKSAYSAMCLQKNGEIAFFFEEAPCHNDDHTKGYSMVYVPLTIEEATGGAFLNPNADVEYVPVEFNIELTDAQGNIYRETLDYIPDDVAAALTAKYPFITLGENGVTTDNKYTNTVTLPFKVSNANTTVWHNFYMPANGTDPNEFFPIYIMANAEDATVVAKITEKIIYGNSQYNTLAYADKLSWAAYSVDNTLTFKFKNKLTGKFMAVNGVVSSGNADNVIYADEANATVFTLTKNPGTNSKCKGDWAITSVYNGTTGYVCNTSASYANATNYTGNDHAGAWFKFVEAPDYQAIVDALIADINNFGEGEGKYVADDEISNINKDALATMPINSLNTQKESVQTVKDNYSEITLTVPVVNDVAPGSVKIKNEAVSNKFVKKGEVTIEAVPAAGYYFVNWTKPAAQASAAARNVEARNAVEVVSTDNPYTFNLTEAVSLEANFDLVVVTATLTDGQGNQYIVKLDGFTNGITKETVAAKLVEKYPYITLGTEATGITLKGSDATYTYTNTVTLPFKVTNTSYIWHNIYWPSNTSAYDYPIYWSASSAEDTYVPKVTGSYVYGAHPTYNTKDGNDKISWAIYNVNNGFEFIFKNKVTQKYIQVTSVADDDAQNVVYVENAEDATAFTIEKKPAGNDYSTPAQYALAAYVGETKGYLCSTSATDYNYATHYQNNTHQGAWIEFVEAPDYFSKIMDLGTVLGMKFGASDGKYLVTDGIQEVIDAMQNSGSITLNNLTGYSSILEDAMNNWPAVGVTINPTDGGTTSINGEENVVHKYVPNGIELTFVATAAEGYHFVNWVDGTNEITTAEYTKTISGGKGDVIALTANFEKNTYTVTAIANPETGGTVSGGGTYNYDDEVTLTAIANDGYDFVGWYNGGVLVSNEANYTFKATSNGEYVANFEKKCSVKYYWNYNRFCSIQVYDEEGNPIIGGTNDVLVKKGSTIQMQAIAGIDFQFMNWTIVIDGESTTIYDNPYSFVVEEDMTLTANFEPVHYVLTVRANDDSYGTVTAESGEFGPASSVKVGIGMEATLTAVAKEGYKFINWTKDGERVSTSATYTVPAISDLNSMIDAEYVANFLPVENADAGTYYRIGYDFPAAETYIYYVGYSTGTTKFVSNGLAQEWDYNNTNELTLALSTTVANAPVYAMNMGISGTANPKLYAWGNGTNGKINPVKYTLSVPEGYIIKNYSFEYFVNKDSEFTITYSNKTEQLKTKTWLRLSVDTDGKTTDFILNSTDNANSITVKNFAVTIQKVSVGGGSETTDNKYYVQSEACGVADKTNALLMTQETDASSIFYYADNKLMSYSTGTYVKEDGDTHGLQGVGGEGGNVTIETVNGVSAIAAPSYMRAAQSGTTCYVDNSSTNNGDQEHNFILEKVTSLPVTISAAGYASFYAPVAVKIPTGVTAYYLTSGGVNKTYVVMTEIEDGIIPANTGVIIGGESKTYDFEIAYDDYSSIDGNLLKGTVATTYVEEDAYVLSMQDGEVGFYIAKLNQRSNTAFQNNSHKAYLPLEEVQKYLPSGTAMSAGFRFRFNAAGSSAVENVEMRNENAEIYDLTGRKLEGISGTGIYIIDGKKVIIR